MSFINNNEFNHRDYNLLIPSATVIPPPVNPIIIPGPITISAIVGFGSPVMCAIDADRSLIVYQRGGVFDLAGVVVDLSSGTPVFGAPVVIDSSIPRVPYSVRMVPGSTTQAVAFYRSTTQIYAKAFDIAGTVISTPYAASNPPSAKTGLSRGYGETLTANTAGLIYEETVFGFPNVSCFAITILAGVTTFGNGVSVGLQNLGGLGSRPVVDSGSLIQFGRNNTGTPSYVTATSTAISGLVAVNSGPYYPPLVPDRIENGATYGQGATIDIGGGVVGFLYQDASTGDVASVRGAYSGSSATYSNSDSNKNILPASPYPPPLASNIQGYGQYSGAGNLGVLSQSNGGNISFYSINISGNVNMASAITLVASGNTAAKTELVFNTTSKISYEYVTSVGGFLACGIAAFA